MRRRASYLSKKTTIQYAVLGLILLALFVVLLVLQMLYTDGPTTPPPALTYEEVLSNFTAPSSSVS